MVTPSSIEKRPSTFEIWFTAARPHTLTASLCPCLVAYAANRHHPDIYLYAGIWTIFCMTVQLGTNLHNDYSDFVQGADTDKRVGHARATAKGWLTPGQTCAAATLCLSITFLCGVGLIAVTQQWTNSFLWFLVLSSVFNAFAYTAGPYPLGYIGMGDFSIAYAGLGDIFVFLYFGLVATWMIPYLFYQVDAESVQNVSSQFIYGLQVGFLAINIIVVNNLRDRHTDVTAGKHTTSVRFGRTFSLMEYVVCDVIAYMLVFVDAFRNGSLISLLPLLSIPLAIKETKAVLRTEGSALNKHVGGAAKVQLAFCVLLSLSLKYGRVYQ